MHAAACTQQYTQVGLMDAKIYCVLYTICAHVKRGLDSHTVHGRHLLYYDLKGLFLLKRFTVILLNAEITFHHLCCMQLSIFYFFPGCYSKYIYIYYLTLFTVAFVAESHHSHMLIFFNREL